jgi:integrase
MKTYNYLFEVDTIIIHQTTYWLSIIYDFNENNLIDFKLFSDLPTPANNLRLLSKLLKNKTSDSVNVSSYSQYQRYEKRIKENFPWVDFSLLETNDFLESFKSYLETKINEEIVFSSTKELKKLIESRVKEFRFERKTEENSKPLGIKSEENSKDEIEKLPEDVEELNRLQNEVSLVFENVKTDILDLVVREAELFDEDLLWRSEKVGKSLFFLLKNLSENTKTNYKNLVELVETRFQIVLEEVSEIKTLIKKKEITRNYSPKPLRDPIEKKHYDLLMENAGSLFLSSPRFSLVCSQLRIIYSFLFYFGLRISEVQQLRLCHIEQVLQGSTLEIYSSKTNSIHRQAVPEEAIEVFKSLKKEINLLFVEAKLTTLTDSVFRTKRTPMSNKHFIRYVNNDIEATLQKFGIAKNYRAHSFRVNLITQLLRTGTSLEATADIIGHKNILSTLRYNRYSLNNQEKIDRLNLAFSKFSS